MESAMVSSEIIEKGIKQGNVNKTSRTSKRARVESATVGSDMETDEEGGSDFLKDVSVYIIEEFDVLFKNILHKMGINCQKYKKLRGRYSTAFREVQIYEEKLAPSQLWKTIPRELKTHMLQSPKNMHRYLLKILENICLHALKGGNSLFPYSVSVSSTYIYIYIYICSVLDIIYVHIPYLISHYRLMYMFHIVSKSTRHHCHFLQVWTGNA